MTLKKRLRHYWMLAKSAVSYSYNPKKNWGVKYEPAYVLDVPAIGPEKMEAKLYVNLGDKRLTIPGNSLYRALYNVKTRG